MRQMKIMILKSVRAENAVQTENWFDSRMRMNLNQAQSGNEILMQIVYKAMVLELTFLFETRVVLLP